MAQSKPVEHHHSLKTMMMKQYLAQRGQAGGSNVRVPEQSSNPKHSLQKCTWSEPGTNVTMNRTIEDILEQTDCEPQNGHANAQTNSTHTCVRYIPSGHSTALHQL